MAISKLLIVGYRSSTDVFTQAIITIYLIGDAEILCNSFVLIKFLYILFLVSDSQLIKLHVSEDF
jgi:hypothetical protein